MKEEIIIRTEDHPLANGRKPKPGEGAYTLRFPTEDGKELVLEMGETCMEVMSNFLIDFMSGRPSYSDGTTNQSPPEA